jgi:hypothetical protein
VQPRLAILISTVGAVAVTSGAIALFAARTLHASPSVQPSGLLEAAFLSPSGLVLRGCRRASGPPGRWSVLMRRVGISPRECSFSFEPAWPRVGPRQQFGYAVTDARGRPFYVTRRISGLSEREAREGKNAVLSLSRERPGAHALECGPVPPRRGAEVGSDSTMVADTIRGWYTADYQAIVTVYRSLPEPTYGYVLQIDVATTQFAACPATRDLR